MFSTEKKYNGGYPGFIWLYAADPGMDITGHSCVVGDNRIFEIEDWMNANQKEWMGEFMADLMKIKPNVSADVWRVDNTR